MILLGIDPGSRVCGYGAIETERQRIISIGYDTIKLKPTAPLSDRIEIIYNKLNQVIKEIKPDVIGVETIFYGKNIQSAFTLGHIRGAILLLVAQNKLPLVEISPREVKKAVTGNGNASKQQVQFMLPKLLGVKLDKLPEDAADALAVAYSLYNKERFR
ncbi:MAG: crossover junction endodeoxyribonuclease RuvC [Candidatus Cloacimonas sp.]|nr:crossover junction endodeoxyribonuclease RuvC [Candidatus Cloacimonadota bacterium]